MRTSGRYLLAAALVAAAGTFLLYRDYQSEVSKHRSVLLARAQTTLDALAAGIRAQGRMGRYRPERLTEIFEELADTPDILGLQLIASDGETVSMGGDTGDAPLPVNTDPVWRDDMLIVSSAPMSLMHAPDGPLTHGPGNGPMWGHTGGSAEPADMEGWQPFPTGPYTLIAVMDTSSIVRESRRDHLRFYLSTAVLLAAVSLAWWVLTARAKQRDLQDALLSAQARTERQEQLARLGAGLAHETKNPLGIVRGLAQLIADAPDSTTYPLENRKRAETIVDEVDRTIGQIDSFLTVSRPRTPAIGSIALDEFIPSLLALVDAEAQRKNTRLVGITTGVVIRADADLLRRTLLNLLINSLRAIREGGEIRVEAARVSRTISLAVSDTGCGIAPEDIEHVTEVYYSKFEGGSGLGLAIVAQNVEAHGWQLKVESQLGKGTRVTIFGIQEATAHGA